MGHHQIEDCSTYTVLLLLTCWVVYAIYGNILVVTDNKDTHCYVAADAIEPTLTIDEADRSNYQDVA